MGNSLSPKAQWGHVCKNDCNAISGNLYEKHCISHHSLAHIAEKNISVFESILVFP